MNAIHELTELSHKFLVAVKTGEESDTYRSTCADLNEAKLTVLDGER